MPSFLCKGFCGHGKRCLENTCDGFPVFHQEPTRRKRDEDDVAAFLKIKEEAGIGTLVAHAPYTLNACAAEERIREFARNTMEDDLKRMEYLPGNLYNFHPGSHVKQGMETGIRLIADQLNGLLKKEQTTTVLLETMCGKGSEVGGRFEELKEILERVELKEKMGVCLDTCHVWDGGYDIVHDLDGVLSEFDRVVGLSRLKAIHLNDSQNPLGARKDRHARIGEGHIGLDAMVRIINHPALKDLPFCLETPNELDGYAREIALLKSKRVEP